MAIYLNRLALERLTAIHGVTLREMTDKMSVHYSSFTVNRKYSPKLCYKIIQYFKSEFQSDYSFDELFIQKGKPFRDKKKNEAVGK